MTYTNELIVKLSSIDGNVRQLRKKAGQAAFYAVVKADAYGLGAVVLSRHLEDKVDGFCVSSMREALELREAGIAKDILVLGYVNPEEYDLITSHKISVTVYNYQLADQLNSYLLKKKKRARIHIKLDTGHGRLGFLPGEESLDQIEKIASMEALEIGGIFSHFATADEENDDYCNLQMARYLSMVDQLEKRSLSLGLKHIANDAGFINHDFALDMVRSGIGIYGVYPSSVVKKDGLVDLEEAFEWQSTISHIKTIEKGTSLSYGRTFIADRDMKIATVSIGYADGYKRLISNKGYVLIRGQRAYVKGNIAMDQMMVDISGIDAKIGDRVVLIGRSGDECLSVDQLAQWCQTISYEIMTSISARVRRIYVN